MICSGNLRSAQHQLSSVPPAAGIHRRFGPTEQDYEAVIKFAETNGLPVDRHHPNRLVLDVEGSVSNIEQAFQVTLRTYRHPTEARDFFAPDTEPSVPANLPVTDMRGLSDYGLPRPLSHKVEPSKVTPLSFNGSGPNGELCRATIFVTPTCRHALTGAGQSVGLLEFAGYYQVDITNYENIIGLPMCSGEKRFVGRLHRNARQRVAGTVTEVSLDIEMAIAMAPGLVASDRL